MSKEDLMWSVLVWLQMMYKSEQIPLSVSHRITSILLAVTKTEYRNNQENFYLKLKIFNQIRYQIIAIKKCKL